MRRQGPDLVIEKIKSPAEIEKGHDPRTEAAHPNRAQKDLDQGPETEKGLGHVTARKVVKQDLHLDHVTITGVVEDLEVDLNLKTGNDPDLGIETEKPVNVVDPDQKTDIQDQKDLDHVKRDLGHVRKDLDHVTGNRLEENEENQSLQNLLRLHPDLNFALK